MGLRGARRHHAPAAHAGEKLVRAIATVRPDRARFEAALLQGGDLLHRGFRVGTGCPRGSTLRTAFSTAC